MFGLSKKEKAEIIKAYIMTKQRTFQFSERKVETNKDFENKFFKTNDGKLYNVDLTAVQFFTDDKKPIFFYIEDIPNPVIFDLKKYVQRFIVEKRGNPDKLVYDDNNNLLDLSFSSLGIEQYKNNNFLKKLLAPMTSEQFKMIVMLFGVLALSLLCIIIIVLFKWH